MIGETMLLSVSCRAPSIVERSKMDAQSMATKVKQLPFKRRVQNLVADLFGTKSDLPVPDKFGLPSSIDKRKNADVAQFAEERRVLWEFAKAHALKQAAENAYKVHKEAFCDTFGIAEDAAEAGTEFNLTRYDVTCLVKVNRPQSRIDREKLRGVMMTELKLTAEKADEYIKKSEKPGKPPVYLTPTVLD